MQEYLDVIYYCCIHTDIHILMILASVNMNLFTIILNRPENSVPRGKAYFLLKRKWRQELARLRKVAVLVSTKNHRARGAEGKQEAERRRTQLERGGGGGQGSPKLVDWLRSRREIDGDQQDREPRCRQGQSAAVQPPAGRNRPCGQPGWRGQGRAHFP